MKRRTFIGAFAWVWALTRSGLERLGQSYKGAAESNQNSQGDRDGVKSGDLHGVKNAKRCRFSKGSFVYPV